MNVESLSVSELKSLLAKAELELAARKSGELQSLLDDFLLLLKTRGYTAAEINQAFRAALKATQQSEIEQARHEQRPAKYFNPRKPEQTWVGYGNRPHWFKQNLSEGLKREDMLIEPAARPAAAAQPSATAAQRRPR